METAGQTESWIVEFIRADGENAHLVQGGFASVGDAEFYGQCLWASPQGRGVQLVRFTLADVYSLADTVPAATIAATPRTRASSARPLLYAR